MDITQELPTVLSLCTGYGGIERGLELAGLEHRVIAHVEIEAFCAANLVNKMEANLLPPAPIYTDIKTLPVQPFRNRVDILTGGYPCQPFSAAGKRLGEDDPRHLWPYIKEIIRAVRPVRCFFENVEGHISLGLREVISDLESLGYKTTWGIFSAREVGAPHQRKRVYILADSSRDGGGRELRELSKKNEKIRESQEHRKNSPRLPDDAGENAGANIMADTDNGQRELKDQEIRARRDSAVDGCADLADTDNPRQQSGCGSIQEPEVRNYIGGGGKELADSPSQFGQRSIAEGVGSGKSQKAIGNGGAFESVADPSSEGSQGSQRLGKARAERFSRGLTAECNNQLADTICTRSETRLPGQERSDKEGNAGIADNCDSEQGGWQIGMHWPPEPRVCRVVDGCADRVDRIRLLGNGVVPATAAKAWRVLSSRL